MESVRQQLPAGGQKGLVTSWGERASSRCTIYLFLSVQCKPHCKTMCLGFPLHCDCDFLSGPLCSTCAGYRRQLDHNAHSKATYNTPLEFGQKCEMPCSLLHQNSYKTFPTRSPTQMSPSHSIQCVPKFCYVHFGVKGSG